MLSKLARLAVVNHCQEVFVGIGQVPSPFDERIQEDHVSVF